MGVAGRAGALILLLAFASLAFAQEPPAYNFGTMQAEKVINIFPGGRHVARIYVYNIYGNRITHVVFSVAEAPPGWEVSLEPGRHSVTTNVSGKLVTVEENLFAEPSPPVPEPPAVVPEGMEYLVAGGVEGYIPAKVLKVVIKAPESAPVGRSYKLRINAKATWLGQGGMVVLSQDRDFEFLINTVAERFSEEIVTSAPEPSRTGYPPGSWRYMAIGGLGAILLLALVFGAYYLLKKRK